MLSWFKKQPSFYRPRITFEQLEERIVLDAAAAPAAAQGLQQADGAFADPADHAAGQPEADTAAGDHSGLDVVLVSDSLTRSEDLAAAAVPEAHVILYDQDTATLSDIVGRLSDLAASEGEPIGHLAVLSHGEPGKVSLGSGEIWTAQSIQAHPAAWQALGGLLAKNARIDIYSCSAGAGEDGAALVRTIAVITSAEVHASDDPTGNVPGADWELEVTSGGDSSGEALIDYDALSSHPVLLLSALEGTEGDDYLQVDWNDMYSDVYGYQGDDTITNDGWVHYFIEGGTGDDAILNKGWVNWPSSPGQDDGNLGTFRGEQATT